MKVAFPPKAQGKIQRWHQTLKNHIQLENYYLPGDREAHIERFVEHYNHRRYQPEALNFRLLNFSPTDRL